MFTEVQNYLNSYTFSMSMLPIPHISDSPKMKGLFTPETIPYPLPADFYRKACLPPPPPCSSSKNPLCTTNDSP